MDNTNRKPLPQLPHGQGSYSYRADGSIEFKKSVNKKRVSVYGKTIKEVNQKMKQKEDEINRQNLATSSTDMLLKDSIINWLETYKHTSLAGSSYDRQEKTIQNQILKYDIALLQVKSITSADIQRHIDILINKPYSYSTVKKTYDCLNEYFSYMYARDYTQNPMLVCKKPTRKSMMVMEEEIEYYNDGQINDFIKEATRIRTYSNNPAHRLGWAFVALIYTGLRINEARALRARDFDFENHRFKIKEQLYRIIDRDIPPDENGRRKYKTIVTPPKRKDSIRWVHMHEKAEKAFKHQLAIVNPNNDPDTFLFASSKTGLPVNERSTNVSLNNIQRNILFNTTGLHVLRHTCCSLYLRAGADKNMVAEMLGQGSTDMIDKVYRHITENEKIAVVNRIVDLTTLKL